MLVARDVGLGSFAPLSGRPLLGAKRTLHVLTFNFDEYRYSKPQTDLTSPPSIRSVEPVIQRAPGDTKKAISSAISSGSP
jgi:hypothetical protein